MNFNITADQLMIKETVSEFATRRILPNRMIWDEAQIFPVDIFREMGEIGLMGMLVPEEYGGAGLGYIEYKIALEEISRVCGSVGLSMAAHNSLCTGHILQFGTEEQKKKYLPKLA
ncbi:MAG: acyl-CoA dehydrogenase family protein, partial [Flavobacteriales bacterium]|nr:acyl-CoA dehydrogenase family protein [Flavobacteriales bacterium]